MLWVAYSTIAHLWPPATAIMSPYSKSCVGFQKLEFIGSSAEMTGWHVVSCPNRAFIAQAVPHACTLIAALLTVWSSPRRGTDRFQREHSELNGSHTTAQRRRPLQSFCWTSFL